MPPYVPPSFQGAGFNCPLCTAFAKQNWPNLFWQNPINNQMVHIPNLKMAACDHCNQFSVWLNQNMVFPNVSTAPC